MKQNRYQDKQNQSQQNQQAILSPGASLFQNLGQSKQKDDTEQAAFTRLLIFYRFTA